MEEAIDRLWPDTPYDERAKKRYRKAVLMLHHTLEMHGIPDIFVSRRGQCYIRPEKLLCDYYDYLKNPGAEPPEEYMFPYPWAEETLAQLFFSRAHTDVLLAK